MFAQADDTGPDGSANLPPAFGFLLYLAKPQVHAAPSAPASSAFPYPKRLPESRQKSPVGHSRSEARVGVTVNGYFAVSIVNHHDPVLIAPRAPGCFVWCLCSSGDTIFACV